MTTERHIWACAKTLMQGHVKEAWFHAKTGADEFLTAGDLQGHAIFKAILRSMEMLENTILSEALR